jgi:hypothetical protein
MSDKPLMQWKCGDKVRVMIDTTKHECKVYGEVYKPKYWLGWHPGPSYLAAIEVYVDKKVYEIPVKEVKSRESG